MSYIKDNFLLNNKQAVELYNGYAKDTPIFDYHCHLSEYQIYDDEPFTNIFDIWLSGDHYKWRMMRNAGVDEELITGSASKKEKFIAYCKALSTAFGNPLYHWSQLELKSFFNCELEINEKNAEAIWDMCNDYIVKNNVRPSSLISGANVKALFTTNEIFDDLAIFDKIKEKNYPFQVLPAFRADKVMGIESPKYNEFIDKLGDIKNLNQLETRIEERLQEFLKAGCLASDTAVEYVYEIASKEEASKVFLKRRSGEIVSKEEGRIFMGYFTYFLLRLYGKYNVRSELHIGATRNNNTVMFNKLGADTGYDGISSKSCIEELSRLMDKLNDEGLLPPMIIFNLNPKMNNEIMTLVGCFQDSSVEGKIQYGPAWWFLDNKVGMERHLQDLTATGHLGVFVGMLTDSRSFLSYPRHHYFRRILCNYLGTMMERGEITQDIEFVGNVVRNISFYNSAKYFKLKY